MSDSWVLRVAKQRRECANCDDWVYVGARYFLMFDGDVFCCACPPDDAEECCD